MGRLVTIGRVVVLSAVGFLCTINLWASVGEESEQEVILREQKRVMDVVESVSFSDVKLPSHIMNDFTARRENLRELSILSSDVAVSGTLEELKGTNGRFLKAYHEFRGFVKKIRLAYPSEHFKEDKNSPGSYYFQPPWMRSFVRKNMWKEGY